MLLSSLIGGGGSGSGGGSYPFARIFVSTTGSAVRQVLDPSGNNDTSWIVTENGKIKILKNGYYFLSASIEPFLVNLSGPGSFQFKATIEPYDLYIFNYNSSQDIAQAGDPKFLYNFVTLESNSLLEFTQSSTGTIHVKPASIEIYKISENVSIDNQPYGSKVFSGSGNFTVPSDVTSISVLMVSSGSGFAPTSPPNTGVIGGTPGKVLYSNAISVTPGDIFNVVVGSVTSITKGTLSLSTSTGGNLNDYIILTSPNISSASGAPCGVPPRLASAYSNGGRGGTSGGGTSLYSNTTGASGSSTWRRDDTTWSILNSRGGGSYGGCGFGTGAGGAGAVRFIWGAGTSFPDNAPSTLPVY